LAKAKGNALALLTASHGAHFDVLKQVLEDVTDSTDDPIDQLTGQLTQVTNLLFGMTFIASSLVEKVAELSEEDREAVLEAAMADEPLMVNGSMGQPIPNGLLNEIRATYQLISQTLARLKVESSEPSGVLGLVGGNRQRAAANRRWRGPGA
jgi:hypothetical protein